LQGIKGLEEFKEYSLLSPSSLLAFKLISLERRDAALFFLLPAVFSDFNYLLSALIFSKARPNTCFQDHFFK
jgi:hypothetical protein